MTRTLYGAGAMGGLVHYVTSAPDFKQTHGSLTLGGNSVKAGGNGKDARASLNIPFVDQSMALRVSAFSRTGAGYIDQTQAARTSTKPRSRAAVSTSTG